MKKLEKENRESRAIIRQSKAEIKELKKYVDKISLMFRSKTKKNRNEKIPKIKRPNQKTTQRNRKISSKHYPKT